MLPFRLLLPIRPLVLCFLMLLLLNLILMLLILLLLMRIAAVIRLRTALRDRTLHLSLLLLFVLMLLSKCRGRNTQKGCQRKVNRFHCFPPASVEGTPPGWRCLPRVQPLDSHA